VGVYTDLDPRIEETLEIVETEIGLLYRRGLGSVAECPIEE
jgi:hypothetical protein